MTHAASTPSVDNVLSVYYAADSDSVTTGLSWYNDAHDVARAMSLFTNLSVAQNAGIIAALSPMMSWETNKKQALKAIVQGNANGLGLKRNCAKVDAIMGGAKPLDVLKGNKVRAFYATILDPAGIHPPVIDRHAFDIAVGRVTDDAARSALGRKGVYQSFADVYMQAATIAGIGAAQMQAVTWTAWRKSK